MSARTDRRTVSIAAERVIADGAYDWQYWVGADGLLRWVSPGVTRLTGYTPSECFSMSEYPLAIAAVEDRDWLYEVLAGAQRGSKGNDLEFRIRRKDGPLRWVAISWQALDTAGEAGYHATVRDITQRKRREERWRVAHRRAAASDRAKTVLVANLSHEIRQPLQAILGGANRLRNAELAPDARHWLEVIEEQANVILRQLEDLVSSVSPANASAEMLATDAAPELTPRPTDLERRWEQVVRDFGTSGKKRSKPARRAKRRRSALLDPKVVGELREVRDESGRTLFARIGRKVLTSVAASLAQLEAERHDLFSARAATLAHRAKGDCLTIGARAAAEAAAALENGIANRDTLAPHLLEALTTSWAETLVWLHDALDADETHERA